MVWDVDSLGYVNNDSPLYLSVEVYVTSYAFKSTQWASIKVNGVFVQEYCLPGASCTGDWYPCLLNMDISNFVQPELGGSLSIEVSVSAGVKTGSCNYPGTGFSLYTRMNLRGTVPTGIPTGEPSGVPSRQPSGEPTSDPTLAPSGEPSTTPSTSPVCCCSSEE